MKRHILTINTDVLDILSMNKGERVLHAEKLWNKTNAQ